MFCPQSSKVRGNVPAVLVLKPFILGLPNPRHAWLVVAMASTLAGNLTILGSVANLIVVQRASVPGRVGLRSASGHISGSAPR